MEHRSALARIEELQAQYLSEKERGDALQARAKDDVDAVMSELDQLRVELVSERAGRASDVEQLNATIQRLQHDLSRMEVAFKEATDKVENLSEQLDTWKSKHAEAVAKARSTSEEAAAEKAQLLEPPG